MKTKHIGIMTLALLMLSSAVLLSTVKAPSWPNLPLTQVQLTVLNGTTSYFVSILSGVPAGFDVYNNGVYSGWCVDRSTTMIRNVSHNVILYSSLSPPSTMSEINWIAVNYIINHRQGNMMDAQSAIWHFTDGPAPLSSTARGMVDAAIANPSYDPMSGSLLAIIALPQNDPGAQISIIVFRIGTPSYDLNSDGKVDIRDISIAAKAFGTHAGQLGFNPDADFNGDGWIDIRDLAAIAAHYGSAV